MACLTIILRKLRLVQGKGLRKVVLPSMVRLAGISRLWSHPHLPPLVPIQPLTFGPQFTSP